LELGSFSNYQVDLEGVGVRGVAIRVVVSARFLIIGLGYRTNRGVYIVG